MSYVYLDKIKRLINDDLEQILTKFKETFRNVYGEYPNIEQIKAWESSIKYLKKALDDRNIHELTIVFEYGLPFSNERIDFLIFGKYENNKPAAIVFELKGWKGARKTKSDLIVISDLGKSVHPEYQVENYSGKIKFSHSEADNFNISTAVLMYNATPENVNLDFKSHVFFKKDIHKLRSFIRNNLPNPLALEYTVGFLNGKYLQSKKLFDAIKKHFKDLQRQSYLTLAENGWGLSSEQLELVDEVIQDLKSDENNVVYLIQGAPGSGKTLIAIHLLLSSLNQGFQTVLAYRNNRLINSIRNIFDSISSGLSSAIKFYSVGPRAGFKGVAEKKFNGPPSLDFVIYDEAQRMTKENIYYALQRAKITVFFYDEKQILNANEEGTTANLKTEANNQNKIVKERCLRGFYRVEGGNQYHKFVETLINNPNKINDGLTKSWIKHYDLQVFENIENLLRELKNKKEQGFKVALIAAFTESPGDNHKKDSIRNLRIGYPLYSGFNIYKNFKGRIYWLMDPINDYVPFWVNGESNKLEKCASIYGCQGFETDYAGIIWGRDYVLKNGNWELGDNCEDNIDRPSLKDLFAKAKNSDYEAYAKARFLLVNRYRILLTRGIKGTYIFCEDLDTAKFLKRIMST